MVWAITILHQQNWQAGDSSPRISNRYIILFLKKIQTTHTTPLSPSPSNQWMVMNQMPFISHSSLLN